MTSRPHSASEKPFRGPARARGGPGADEDGESAWWLVGRRDALARGARQGEGRGEEEWIGPFSTYAEARSEWRNRAWGSVDDAAMRWRIVERGGPVGHSSD